MAKITLDTNTLPLERAMLALRGVPAHVMITSITAREVYGTKWEAELSMLPVPASEVWVMGESPFGVGVLGTQADADLFEETLIVTTNGSFPKRGSRSTLTDPQRRQMRDAMIFCTHVREGRDIFVTDDVTAFGGANTSRRQTLEDLGRTRIMTLIELEQFCAAQKR